MTTPASTRPLLNWIERQGNRLPHPTVLFMALCVVMLVLSAITHWLGFSATHPTSGELINAQSLLSKAGVQHILDSSVDNFIHFAPVGTVLVVMLGMGIAEQSGLMQTALNATVRRAPKRWLSGVVVLAGVLSNLAMDAGYVVLIPLAALAFISAGRHPLIGIAAAFAGVSGGFSANLLLGPFDAIMAGISQEAARIIEPGYNVSIAANYYFLLVSTLLITLLGTWVTERFIAPRFEQRSYRGNVEDTIKTTDTTDATEQTHAKDQRGLRWVGIMSIGYAALLILSVVPEGGWLRGDGGFFTSPFIQGIVVLLALYAALAGTVFAIARGTFTAKSLWVEGMESAMRTMAPYLVLMFFAAQCLDYFSWSQIGIITAINGAEALQSLPLNLTALLLCFIVLIAFINLLIGSASAKWALLAPVFVPMLMLVGISPEASQVAFRIGDSSTNIITPLMPYFGVVVAFAQRYDRDAGIGTIMAMMIPYSIAFLIGWSLLLSAWLLLGLPLGPGVNSFLAL